jgi:3-oxoacyl-[acyl-carrier protein] reductase
MDLGLTGKRAAVAASSAGLGYASAAALVAEGARVAMCGRDKGRIDAAAAQLGPNAIALVADVARQEGATAFVTAAQDALGGIDILVTNGGGPPPGDFASTPLEAYSDALELNLLSVVAMCYAAVPSMREQGWGRVVAITSIAVRQPRHDLILSNTARTGATGFLRTLAREVAKDGITVNSVLPGIHATARMAELYPSMAEAARGVPRGVVGDPADFGQVVAFLCSQQAQHVTGVALQIDGGTYPALL